MSSEPADLTSVLDAVRSLAAPSPGELSDAAAVAWLDQVEQLGRHVDALRVHAAGDIAERSRRELGAESLARRHGAQSAGTLIERIARVSATEAARRIRLGSDTAPRYGLSGQPMPARFDRVARALDAGVIGVDAALAIVRNLAAAERGASFEAMDAAETHLVEQAAEVSADLVSLEARAWRTALDPDGTEPRDAELRGRRKLVLGREVDGMTPFWGEADPVSASQLRTWLAERTAPDRRPRFLDPQDVPIDGEDELARDPRAREQRQFDVLMGLLLAGVRAEADVAGPRHGAANVMVVIHEPALRTGRGTAWISDSAEPISVPPRRLWPATPAFRGSSWGREANRWLWVGAKGSIPRRSGRRWWCATAADAHGRTARPLHHGRMPTIRTDGAKAAQPTSTTGLLLSTPSAGGFFGLLG
jgi:hypothetical protein